MEGMGTSSDSDADARWVVLGDEGEVSWFIWTRLQYLNMLA